MKKLLFFGGAFNPPHVGHEQMLKGAIEVVDPDLTIIVPTGTSPHKQSGEVKFYHRYMMSKVFKRLFDRVIISTVENSGRKKKNYTIQTLKKIEKKYTGYEIYMLIGSDMLLSFRTWSRYKRVLAKTALVVAVRKGYEDRLEETVEGLAKEGARVILMPFSPVDISSNEIRIMLKNGENADKFLNEETLKYINRHNLYK